MTKICETCEWWHDSACACLNEKSDKFTEQVAHTETCGEWETAEKREAQNEDLCR